MCELTDDKFEEVAAQLQVNVWAAEQAAKEQRKAFLNTPKGKTVAWAKEKDQGFDDSIIACTELELTDKAGWEKWIKINTGDEFVDIVTRWAKLMQFEIDVNHKPLAKIADDTLNRAAHHSAEEGLNYSGLWKLEFYEGATVLAIVWKYGADLRQWAESPEFQKQHALSEAFTGIPKSTPQIKKSDRPAFE